MYKKYNEYGQKHNNPDVCGRFKVIGSPIPNRNFDLNTFTADTLGMEGEYVGPLLERKPSLLEVDPAHAGRSPSPEEAKKKVFTKWVAKNVEAAFSTAFSAIGETVCLVRAF